MCPILGGFGRAFPPPLLPPTPLSAACRFLAKLDARRAPSSVLGKFAGEVCDAVSTPAAALCAAQTAAGDGGEGGPTPAAFVLPLLTPLSPGLLRNCPPAPTSLGPGAPRSPAATPPGLPPPPP
eukprot:CAMPEP_0197590638 /NCGR_PEP_ID=MMETSP1326-20131121/11746_1 /TAXON_ID=1155430 /ORGANISM="Genus nov. species nov., Strain RCC2288" /LENGTH=123 /DNA_ID=CAMNT_0043155789 /DNA_START=460 /DNA_END=827 /DNA_ORIENTATION=-